MAMSVVYTTVNGQVLSENRGGVVHHFNPDPLGSVVMVRDTSGNTVYEAEYAPYGDVQSETGTNPSEFGYVGTLGYVKDSASSLYVRARYLLTNLGRWLTKDPLWPSEPGYVYAGADPNMSADPSGLAPCVGIDCDDACKKFIAANPSICGDLPSPPYPPGSNAWAFAFCCDGKPHHCYCPGQEPSPNPYIKACLKVHEHGHIPPGGCAPGYTGSPPKINDECTAIKAGIKCANEQCRNLISNDCIALGEWKCHECRRLKFACTPMPADTWLRQYCKGRGV